MDIREHFYKIQLNTIMAKRKEITFAITQTQRKSRGYLTQDQKLRGNLKR